MKPAVSKDVRDGLLRRQLITYYQLSASTIMPNTSVLWGRGITQVECGATGAIALSETGELFAWGGTARVSPGPSRVARAGGSGHDASCRSARVCLGAWLSGGSTSTWTRIKCLPASCTTLWTRATPTSQWMR